MIFRVTATSGDIVKYKKAFRNFLISEYIKHDLTVSPHERYMDIDIITLDDLECVTKNVQAINRSADVIIEHRVNEKEIVLIIKDCVKRQGVSFFKFSCLKCRGSNVYVETILDGATLVNKIVCDDCGYFEDN